MKKSISSMITIIKSTNIPTIWNLRNHIMKKIQKIQNKNAEPIQKLLPPLGVRWIRIVNKTFWLRHSNVRLITS